MRRTNAPFRTTARQSRSRTTAKRMLLRCGSSDVMADGHASYQCAISRDGAAVSLTHDRQHTLGRDVPSVRLRHRKLIRRPTSAANEPTGLRRHGDAGWRQPFARPHGRALTLWLLLGAFGPSSSPAYRLHVFLKKYVFVFL